MKSRMAVTKYEGSPAGHSKGDKRLGRSEVKKINKRRKTK